MEMVERLKHDLLVKILGVQISCFSVHCQDAVFDIVSKRYFLKLLNV